jgi:CheY-like chemotaxis protein
LQLSLARTIACNHGGFVRAITGRELRPTIELYLPAVGTMQKGAEIPSEELRGNGQTILVVDNEPALRKMMEMTLQTAGYQTLSAGDGAEAAARYAGRSAEIALILTDINMPIMGGAELVRALRRVNPAARIVVTGQANAAGTSDLVEAGIDAFLIKPYPVPGLLQTIRDLLGTAPENQVSRP